jgi:hypothetical protein
MRNTEGIVCFRCSLLQTQVWCVCHDIQFINKVTALCRKHCAELKYYTDVSDFSLPQSQPLGEIVAALKMFYDLS